MGEVVVLPMIGGSVGRMVGAVNIARERRDTPALRRAFTDPLVATIDHAIAECDRIGVKREVREKLCQALALAMFDHLIEPT